ncbi:MAG: glycoside hydrolase family 5 protein, partial [Treponema sp.]|nr:glycoside hydrolase family 5 protein [Treponema sp.]
MKLSKKVLAFMASLTLLSALFAQDYVHNKNVKLPDTSSTKVTKAQEMDKKLTATELTKIMGNGINLGNTMEAYRAAGMSTKQAATSYEVLWGQPVTTEKMIKGYKAAGFDTIRIPIAWTNAIDYLNGDYTINKDYLDRVETIVTWALNAGMYVIINDHWDGGWWGLFGQREAAYREDAVALYKAIWTQVGIRFKNYSDKLIFEGGNEEIGDRLNDASKYWKKGALNEDGCYTMANFVNQTFVDTIRSQGGNNENRFLLIPGYNTNIDKTVDSRFKMPNDTAKERLLISVHYYDPSDFAIGGGDLWGTKADYEYQNAQFKKMEKFVNEGYGVIIGEYGALPNNGNYKTSTLPWTKNVIDNCDAYNYVPVLWDTGSACFYNKGSAKLIHKELVDLYKARAVANEKDYKKVQKTALAELKKAEGAAKNSLDNNPLVGRKDVGIGYIMYSDANWVVTYSVGDEYKPTSKTKGLKAIDAEITGPGTYTLALDFSEMKAGKASGFSFCAIGIENGEALFPDYAIDIKEIKVDGKPVKMTAKGYTATDNGKTTRINLVNDWVTSIPKTGIRTPDGNLDGVKAVILDKKDGVFKDMKKLEITFEYGPA